ncbi:Zinc fingerZZ type family protein [Aphelenchoides avenae]|nr:Zinc fingerZZ type family protein [Aphelenchus avenae]
MWPPPHEDPGAVAVTSNGADLHDGLEHEQQSLIDEMRQQDFDSIRFATYRTGCKLRFIQKKTNVHLVDIWNMIESFRENGLNAMPMNSHLKTSRLELLLTSVFHNLNKRLPTSQQIDTDRSISMLLSFLLGAYDKQHLGRISVFAVKVALATLCAGKLADKLRYVFSQISNSSGFMEYERFAEYLQQVLALPSAVFEAPTFGFSEAALSQCFKKGDQVNLNQFLDVIMGESCPPCLMWLPLLHRLASVEHVYHPVVCDACQAPSLFGFRYKCQRCTNYQLCQSCFWRGRTSGSHSNEHEMKEYSSYKSPTKQIAHSIQKSLQCMPVQLHKPHKDFTVKQQRPLDLANIVPAFRPNHRPSSEPIADWTSQLLPGQYGNGNEMDDEHRLIARYAAKLAGRTVYPSTHHLAGVDGYRESLDERRMIAQLEEENNELLREMSALEQQQQTLTDSNGQLNGLRERTVELEVKMREKQQTRRQLMQQLETLMSQLNTTSMGTQQHALSLSHLPEPLHGVGSMVSNAFRDGSMGYSAAARAGSMPAFQQLQGDLLNAADSITTNMGTLVQELNEAADDESPIGMNGNGHGY